MDYVKQFLDLGGLMKKLLTFIPLIAMVAFAISAFAQQNKPLPPQHLRVFVESNKSDYFYTVKLAWERNPNGVAPQVFVVYSEFYTLNGVVIKKIIGYVPVDTSGNRSEYSYTIEHLKAGMYVFYVTAAIYRENHIVESEPSNNVRVELKGQNEQDIIIYSQPPKVAFVGYTYRYQVLAQTTHNCVIDSYELLSAPDGMKISEKGVVEWTPTDIGEFPVKIKVASTGCPDLKPAIQEYEIKVYRDTIPNKAYIRIISQPPTTAVVRKTWVYRIVAESNIRCPIDFELLYNPDNVEFKKDEATIYWTPIQPGVYYFAIKAYLTCDTTVVTHQQFAVTVKQYDDDHQTCAVIQGTATYEDNSLVPNGVVIAWRLNDHNVPDRKVFKTYIHQGQFEFYLPEGIYILEFDGETFEHKFYENANTIAEATKIEVKCDDSVKKHISITMVLHKKPEPVHYNVSGKVVSAEDNSPVMAMVEFIPVELLYYNDHREKYPDYYNFDFVAKTDENGDYTIKLPNIFTYKAHAIPIDKKNYMDQYYDQVSSPFEADIIELTGDVDNINFFLKSPPNHQNGFTGIVIDENRNPIKSRVFAYLVNPSVVPDAQHYVRMVETNEQGQFMFKNLIPGEYVLFSIPVLRTYVPGYYKQNDFATLKWREATRIGVGDVMLQMIFEIKHRTRTGLRGLIRVDGRVVEDRGFIKVGNEPQGENPVGLSDAYVYVLDENGNLSDYSVTDFDGRFSLIEVPEGTTTLYVNKPGYAEAQLQLTGDYQRNFAFNYEIPISRIILTVDETNGLPFIVTQNENNIRIELNTNTGIINFAQVYDAMGRVMYESKDNSSNFITLTTPHLNSGVYFVRIGSSLGIYSIKFVVFR